MGEGMMLNCFVVKDMPNRGTITSSAISGHVLIGLVLTTCVVSLLDWFFVHVSCTHRIGAYYMCIVPIGFVLYTSITPKV